MVAPSFTSISNPWSSLLSYLLSAASILYLSLSGIPFLISYPLNAEDSPFQNFQWMPSSEKEGQRKLPPEQQSQTETWDPA